MSELGSASTLIFILPTHTEFSFKTFLAVWVVAELLHMPLKLFEIPRFNRNLPHIRHPSRLSDCRRSHGPDTRRGRRALAWKRRTGSPPKTQTKRKAKIIDFWAEMHSMGNEKNCFEKEIRKILQDFSLFSKILFRKLSSCPAKDDTRRSQAEDIMAQHTPHTVKSAPGPTRRLQEYLERSCRTCALSRGVIFSVCAVQFYRMKPLTYSKGAIRGQKVVALLVGCLGVGSLVESYFAKGSQ